MASFANGLGDNTMLTIDGQNNIALTRGDTCTIVISMTKNGNPYLPVEGDSIRFAISKSYATEKGYRLIMEKPISTDTLQIYLSSEETKLPDGTYNYDIEITHEDGAVDTFISATFTIEGECR